MVSAPDVRHPAGWIFMDAVQILCSDASARAAPGRFTSFRNWVLCGIPDAGFGERPRGEGRKRPLPRG